MNRLHIAALAVVAWFMVLPPLDPSTQQPAPDAPIGDWIAVGKFTTSDHCEKIRANESPSAWSDKTMRALVPYARCIEDDDSRRIGPGLRKGSEREP
jgi:hypothetical protein